MKLFDKGKDYHEYSKTPNKKPIEDLSDPTPMIDKLPDGKYKGKRYGYQLELDDGRVFKTEYGVRYRKSDSPKFRDLFVKDGKILFLKESKYSGMTEVVAGLQGMSYGRKANHVNEVNRVTVDSKGFRIPEKVKSAFKIKDSTYSMNKTGEYKGSSSTPSVGVKEDSTIMRGSQKNRDPKKETSEENKVTNVSLDWNPTGSFHLSIEPWITAPLMSDVEDGLYLGSVKGTQLDTGKRIIMLGISVEVEYPESVVSLIKNQKAYIFKQSQMTATTGSKIFSRAGSELYGIQKKSNGSWGVMSHRTGVFSTPDYESEEDAIDASRLLNSESVTDKSYSDSDTKYTFEYALTSPKMELQAVIGTLVMSSSFAQLLHLVSTDYVTHMILDDYYKEIPEKVDKLAEAYLATTNAANFQVVIAPRNMDPETYIGDLLEFVGNYRSDSETVQDSTVTALLDDIIILLRITLYKLRRLKSGKKVFSILSNENKIFSNRSRSARLNKDQVGRLKESLTEMGVTFIRKFRKSPVKEVKDGDEKGMREYVKNTVVDDNSFAKVFEAVINGTVDTMKSMSPKK